MNKKLFQFLKWFIPYGIIKRRHEKRLFKLDTQMKGEFPDFEHKFKTVLSVQGLGYSGHSALVDLLREYSSIKTPAMDIFGEKNFSHYEFNMMRMAGCPMEFEKFLGQNNLLEEDAVIHRMKKNFETFPFITSSKNLMKYTSLYLSNLIAMVLPDLSIVYYNQHLHMDDMLPDKSIYLMKGLNLKEFRELTRQFLTVFCNEFYEEGKEVLALNHFFSDEYDFERRNTYIPNVKALNIFRDPRDVYYIAKKNDVEWIAHSSAQDFVKWCQIRYKNFDVHSTAYLPVRFEDLVLNYETEVKRIEEYVGLKPESHVLKHKYLDPSKSCKNVGLWKKDPALLEDMKYIEANLYDMCYHGELI